MTSEVNGKRMCFDAKKLGEILGVLATSFDIYVREDKSVLGNARLLELSQRLSQQMGLKTPQSVKKSSFIIKNVILRGQGRNLADAMDQCFFDLMDREEQINLPAIMIRHIARIETPPGNMTLGMVFLGHVFFSILGWI